MGKASHDNQTPCILDSCKDAHGLGCHQRLTTSVDVTAPRSLKFVHSYLSGLLSLQLPRGQDSHKLEQLCKKFDHSLFAFGSSSKKRHGNTESRLHPPFSESRHATGLEACAAHPWEALRRPPARYAGDSPASSCPAMPSCCIWQHLPPRTAWAGVRCGGLQVHVAPVLDALVIWSVEA